MASTKTATAAAARYVVEKNGPREYAKEARNGRIYEGMVTTWDVVEPATCSLVTECRTKREAAARCAELNAQDAADQTMTKNTNATTKTTAAAVRRAEREFLHISARLERAESGRRDRTYSTADLRSMFNAALTILTNARNAHDDAEAERMRTVATDAWDAFVLRSMSITELRTEAENTANTPA